MPKRVTFTTAPDGTRTATINGKSATVADATRATSDVSRRMDYSRDGETETYIIHDDRATRL